MKIFAYGSNMNINRLRNRVPSATKLTNAFITGYFLTCNKVSTDGSAKANIIKSDNLEDEVWGVIFEIADNEKEHLDRAEGLGKGYTEMKMNFIDLNNINHEAQVYVAENNSINNKLLPFDWYRRYIITGAKENHLPSKYLRKLESLEFVVDANEDRRKKNIEISNEKK